METELKKGRGHKAQIGEVRVHSNGKWKKTAPGSNGWEQLKDIHRSKSGDGHEVHVHTITPEKAYFHVHDSTGKKVANGKLTHEDFKNNYTPVTIHFVDDNSHVSNYYKNDLPSEAEPLVDTEDEIDEVPFMNPVDDEDEVLDDDIPEIIVDTPDDDELEEEAISPYKLNLPSVDPTLAYTMGSLVRFMTDGRKKEGRIEDIAPNGILTVNSGGINHYISPRRLIN